MSTNQQSTRSVCPECEGDGDFVCSNCCGTGEGRVFPRCPVCQGSGHVTCMACDGTGVLPITLDEELDPPIVVRIAE